MLRRLACGILAVLMLTAFHQPAQAQSTERKSSILLTVAAPADAAEKLAAVARELLQRLPLQVVLRRVEHIELRELRQPLQGEPAYFARVWVAFGKTGKARLYLEHSARDRVLVRDVTDDANNPELVREELGHILQTALEGLQAGAEIGAPRSEALKQVEDELAAAERPPAPTKRTSETQRAPGAVRRRGLRFGPRYEAVWLNGGSLFQDGPGAVLNAPLPTSPRFGLELGGFFRRPLKVEGSPVGARLQSLAVNALITFEAWQGTGARLRLGTGFGADFVRVSPFANAGLDVTLAKTHWLKMALGRAALTYAHDVASFMALEVTLGAELDPNGTRYVFQRAAGTADVLAPWPVRPLLSLGGTVP